MEVPTSTTALQEFPSGRIMPSASQSVMSFSDFIPLHKDGNVKVLVSEADKVISDEEVSWAVFGSSEHFVALNRRINQLDGVVNKNIVCRTDIRPEQLQALLPRAREELALRQRELSHLTTYIDNQSEDGASSDSSGKGQDASQDMPVELVSYRVKDGLLDLEDKRARRQVITAEHIVRYIDPFDEKYKHRLFRPPQLRQWYSGHTLFMDKSERRASWMETLLDLFYLICISNTATYLDKPVPSPATFYQFVLVFTPIYTQWVSTLYYMNRFCPSNTVDFYQAMVLIANMMLVESLATPTKYVFTSTNETDGTASQITGTASAFLQILIAMRILIALEYAVVFVFIPKIRKHVAVGLASNVIGTIPWIVCVALPIDPDGVGSIGAPKMTAWWIACIFDGLALFMGIISPHLLKNIPHRMAINMDHLKERFEGLIIIFIGAMVADFTVDAINSAFNAVYFSTFMGILISWNIMMLYFRCAASGHYQHASRRNRLFHAAWNFIHLPLCMFIVSAGAALKINIRHVFLRTGTILVTELETDMGTDLPFSAKAQLLSSLGLCFILFAIMGCLHKGMPLDHRTPIHFKRLRLTTRHITLGIRVLFGLILIVCAFCPLPGVDTSAMTVLAIATTLCLVEQTFEEVLRIYAPLFEQRHH
ncbi:hypothetical protein RI367_003807 [Sorochytrium milnesiophthora]